ncbi:glycosyl transferase family 39 [Geobacter metallireducens RCH3]|uniref:Undecaprenyl-diphospho-4-amino-4-deoxy-L-arabinose--lipid A 4-amino-4-deoxy-L-arabinose transferase, putative n=1 Tax=Geobacter metallireducens (strain ATCC 53774 / DSM 7210 / GS-15) TaxID=269799 RepID=Q39X95_GEOMG|nr:glycosyltransferase family 39 protein [Geobacter metallireducens]ABB31129.1 undecaprenyl-diphospho-4-amino-4-deoxy-L-arabinose--lipid A 4-amino-4-deoxy-L-arabinose transferase, putative [Geobacter metallireducens GS-15]EHP86911.1 glycosyl transferase family 39 [Geobacter metallireducens RCH3]
MKTAFTVSSNREQSLFKDLIILAVVFGFAFFQRLGQIPLLDSDEGRYAEIPREMLERGDFITPFLNYVKYFEKPPLHYWLEAISFRIFGFSEFAARAPGALMGLCGVLFTYHVGRTVFGRRAGLLAATVLGTSLGFIVIGRYNVIDMTLTFWMTATLGCFLLAVHDRGRRAGLYYYLFYVAAALTVLAKGLIGLVLPGGVIVLFILLTGRWRLLREMRLPTGTVLFLLVAAPWFILVSLHNPEFPRFFFIHEHFERFLTKVHGRYEPPWFFIPVLAGFMLPWSFYLPSAIRGMWQERHTPTGEARLYLILWGAVIFTFFSLSSSKLIPYILPVFPAVALLVGEFFSRVADRRATFPTLPTAIAAAVLTIGGAGGILFPHLAKNPKLSVLAGAVIGSCLLAQGIAAFVGLRRKKAAVLLVSFGLFSYLLGIAGPPFILARTAERKSFRELGQLVKEKAGPDTAVASFQLYQQGFSYYAGRRIIIVGERGELDFGSRQGDQSQWFLDEQGFARLWDSGRPVIVLIKEDALPALRKLVTTPPRELGRKGKVLLIANH